MRVNKGFTLIELMVTVVIIIVVLAVGLPGITQLRRNNELVTITNSIVGALNTARSEAVRRGANVRVSPNPSWGDGWVVKLADNSIYRVFEKPSSDATISASAGQVTFNSLGNATSAVCIDVSLTGSDKRSIPVSNTGRVTTCRDTCSAITADPNKCL